MTRPSENLLSTYLAIGRTLPGAEVRETEGYVALTSDLPHPAGNFAARLRLDPWLANELRALAEAQPAFRVVALPEDEPPYLAELLRGAGFEEAHRLAAMVATPPFGLAGLDMAPCEETDRPLVGRLMMDAFYARETLLVRQAMAEAITATPSLSTYVHMLRERPAAAVALSREDGVLGVYNLFVAAPHRGKGLGGAVVEWCLAQAAAEGLVASLQCSLSLEGWYARRGFERTGLVTVWRLAGSDARGAPPALLPHPE